jgi:hypothetical protein
MITKRIEIGKLEILKDGQIQVRQDTVFEENGKEQIRTYHRVVLPPNDETNNIIKMLMEAIKL